MADTPITDPSVEQNAFLCAIGHVCLQWARLEQTILFIIGVVESQPIHKAYKMFAGLDMIPRLNMAIQLAQEAKMPHIRFIKPLQEIRKEVQRDGTGLGDRRNMFVHGAHKFGTNHGEFVLTMSRWKGDRQSQTVTLLDAGQLATEIAIQAQKAEGIFDDYGVWKFGTQNQHNSNQQIAQTKAALRLMRAQQVKRALKLLWANLKPW